MSKFTVYADRQNEFRWKFAANDNTVIAKSSQGYKAKDDCVAALNLLQKDVAGATVDHEVAASSPQASKGPAPVAAAGAKPVAPVSALAASPAASPAPGVIAQN